MRDPKKRAKSLAIYWLRKCYDEGLTAGEIVAESVVTKSAVTTVTAKENEGEKRTSPLDPPIEKRAKQEKAPPPPLARARAREGKKKGTGNPTFEQVEKYAAICEIPQDFAKQWFDRMNRENEFGRWRHPKTDKHLKCWRSYLRSHWKRHDEFDRLPKKEPEPKPTKPIVVTREDWELCAERCRFFDAAKGVCTKHITIPPPIYPGHPHQPQECEMFGEKQQ